MQFFHNSLSNTIDALTSTTLSRLNFILEPTATACGHIFLVTPRQPNSAESVLVVLVKQHLVSGQVLLLLIM